MHTEHQISATDLTCFRITSCYTNKSIIQNQPQFSDAYFNLLFLRWLQSSLLLCKRCVSLITEVDWLHAECVFEFRVKLKYWFPLIFRWQQYASGKWKVLTLSQSCSSEIIQQQNKMHSAISAMYFKINDIGSENIGNLQLQGNSLTAAVTQHFTKSKKADCFAR